MTATTRINEVLAEALDAIGDDEEYAAARRELLAAQDALASGTTAQVQAHLDEGLLLIDLACPLGAGPGSST